MFDVSTTNLIQQLTSIGLPELRDLHSRIVDAEEITRSLIRRREAQQRRDERLQARGLNVVGALGE